jgi:hypothetical protein
MILYKYFDEEKYRNLWLEGHGRIYFSLTQRYAEKSCDKARKDELENTTIYRGRQTVSINGQNFLAENIKISDDIIGNFISSFSLELSDYLKEKFGQYVLSFDASGFLSFLDSVKMDDVILKHGRVEYSDLSESPSSIFRKEKKFEPEKEYRILMKIPTQSKIDALEINQKHVPFEIEGLKKDFLIL